MDYTVKMKIEDGRVISGVVGNVPHIKGLIYGDFPNSLGFYQLSISNGKLHGRIYDVYGSFFTFKNGILDGPFKFLDMACSSGINISFPFDHPEYQYIVIHKPSESNPEFGFFTGHEFDISSDKIKNTIDELNLLFTNWNYLKNHKYTIMIK